MNSQDARLLFFLKGPEYPLHDLAIGCIEHIEIFHGLLIYRHPTVDNGMAAIERHAPQFGCLEGNMLEPLEEYCLPAHRYMKKIEKACVLCDQGIQLFELPVVFAAVQDFLVDMIETDPQDPESFSNCEQ